MYNPILNVAQWAKNLKKTLKGSRVTENGDTVSYARFNDEEEIDNAIDNATEEVAEEEEDTLDTITIIDNKVTETANSVAIARFDDDAEEATTEDEVQEQVDAQNTIVIINNNILEEMPESNGIERMTYCELFTYSVTRFLMQNDGLCVCILSITIAAIMLYIIFNTHKINLKHNY